MVRTICLALLVVAGTGAEAYGDVFAFSDVEGFERCLATDHLIETVKTQKGEQTRVLGPAEIQVRCVDAAVKLLAGNKDKDTLMSFLETAKRGTAQENAIGLAGLLADASLPACNDMALYEVLLKALSHPKAAGSSSYFARARGVVKRCLKDPDFKKDFLEEKDSSDSYVAANACAILLEEKLVKTCKGGKK